MQQAPVRLYRASERTGHLKGRQVDAASLDEVRALLGPRPEDGHARDLLIEHLHRLNDHWHGLQPRHLAALAQEMNLPMAEVFEVASFYHHFEILKDGEAGPALTVRVCDGLPCEMAGARDLLQRLPALLGPQVRVIPAPCIGRCEQAPAAQVGQRAVPHASEDRVAQAVAGADLAPVPQALGYDAYRAQGGYALAAAVVRGERDAESVITALEPVSYTH